MHAFVTHVDQRYKYKRIHTAQVQSPTSHIYWQSKGLQPDVNIPYLPPGNLPLPISILQIDKLLERFGNFDVSSADRVIKDDDSEQLVHDNMSPEVTGSRSFSCQTFWACGWENQ